MLDPSIPLSIKPPQIQSPLEAYAKLRAVQSAGQEYEKGNIELQQAKQAQQDDQTMRQIMQQHSGDIETALPAMAGKISSKAWIGLQNQWIEQQKNKFAMQESQEKVADAAHESIGKLALGVRASGNTPEAFTAAVNSLVKLNPAMAQHLAPYVQQAQQDPSKIGPMMDQLIAGTTVGQKQQEVEAAVKTAQSRETTAETGQKRLTAELPGIGARGTIAQQEAAGQAPIQPYQQPEYQIKSAQAKALSSMSAQDWQDFIDRVIPDKNSPAYRRAQSMVSFYVKKGDLKSAEDAVKAEAAGLRSTETAVSTAKATAPIKIEVAAQQAQTRADVAEQGRTRPPVDYQPGSREYQIAKQLAYGDMTFQQFARLYSRSQDINTKLDIYNLASKINPNFNSAQFEMGYRFASNPKVRQQLAAMDNVQQAIPDLLQLSDAAARTGVPLLNQLVLKGGYKLGNKSYSNLAVARTAFADELSGALGFGSATDMSKEMGLNMTDPNLSPDAFRSAIQNVVKPFIERKRQTLLNQMGVYGQPGGGGATPNAPATGGRKPLNEIFK